MLMGLNDNIELFKKLVPQDKLGAKDKELVLKTISSTKLFLDLADLVTFKHGQTRVGIIEQTSKSQLKSKLFTKDDINSVE